MAKRTFRRKQLRISTLDYKTMEYIEKMRNSSVRIEAGKMRLDVAIADDGQSVDIIYTGNTSDYHNLITRGTSGTATNGTFNGYDAYFNHSVHLNKGVGCASCHGRVDQMPLVWKESPLTMEWCLACHRAPEKHLRPKEEIFNMKWAYATEAEQLKKGRELIEKNHVPVHRLSDCSTCHR